MAHGDAEVCVNAQCYPIDSHRACLNVDDSARSFPLLLWSGHGFSPLETTTVQIRLSGHGATGGLSFEKAVYTESRMNEHVNALWPHRSHTDLNWCCRNSNPLPETGAMHSKIIQSSDFTYEESHWWREGHSPTGPYHWAATRLANGRSPQWWYWTRGKCRFSDLDLGLTFSPSQPT